ncbi:unnamed protein product [Diamesa serratosioi]
MESLKGIFPNVQSPPKRDFLRENVMRIKRMQEFQRNKKNSNMSEYGNRYNRQTKARKNSNTENQLKYRSTNSLAVIPTKPSISNLRKTMSVLTINSSCKDSSSQTVDTNDDMFLKDTIIRYPSASTIRDLPALRPAALPMHKHKEDNRSRVMYKSHFNDQTDDHCNKMDQHLTNLSEFLDKTSISKNPSILKIPTNASTLKYNKNYINEAQRNQRGDGDTVRHTSVSPIDTIALDDEETEETKNENTAGNAENIRKLQMKAAEEDPDCPEGHVPLSENERIEALQLAQKRFKVLVDDLNRLPMTAETLRVRNRKIEIEKELRKLDTNIRTFSRKKVYVKLE